MSTPTTTPNTKPTGWIVATVVAASLALAGIVAGLLMALGSPARAGSEIIPEQFIVPSASGHHSTPVNPNPRPHRFARRRPSSSSKSSWAS